MLLHLIVMKTKILFLFILLNCLLWADDNYSIDSNQSYSYRDKFDFEIMQRKAYYKDGSMFDTYRLRLEDNDSQEKLVNFEMHSRKMRNYIPEVSPIIHKLSSQCYRKFKTRNQRHKCFTDAVMNYRFNVNELQEIRIEAGLRYSKRKLKEINCKEQDLLLTTEKLQGIQQKCIQNISSLNRIKKLKQCISYEIVKIWERN